MFNQCRKGGNAKLDRDKRHDDIKSNIQEIENEFDENGILIQDDKECIIM